MVETQPVLHVQEVSKAFGATQALRNVSLQLVRGEVRALLGHNGSGKSTLIKILAGYHRPDNGQIWLNGTRVEPPVTSGILRHLGLGILHQDLGLVDTMSVLENIRIGAMSHNCLRKIQWKHERQYVTELLQEMGVTIDPLIPVGRLSVAQRVAVAIARAFDVAKQAVNGVPVILLDEPTAALGESEIEQLFTSIDRLAATGCAFLLVTHKPAEVLTVAQSVTVLRDGAVVADRTTVGMTASELTDLIIGLQPAQDVMDRTATVLDAVGLKEGQRGTQVEERAGQVLDSQLISSIPRLQVVALAGRGVKRFDLSLAQGEIVGVTGLQGSGFEDVPGLIFGWWKRATGDVVINGVSAPYLHPWQAVRNGMAFVSGDRLREGGVAHATLTENVSMTNLHRLVGWLGYIIHSKEVALVSEVVKRFGIRPGYLKARFTTLSGGNQQKALIGRWVVSGVRVLLMHEPTAGVDVGSVGEIATILRQFAAEGGSVLIASSQVEDLVGLCDRVLVMAGGEVVAELAGGEVNTVQLIRACYNGNRGTL